MEDIQKTIDNFARMVQDGFGEAKENNDKQFAEIRGDLTQIVGDVSNIKLRLDNVAHRFELRELDIRVKALEQKQKAV